MPPATSLHRLDIDPGIGVAICVFARHGYRILVLPTIDSARRPVSEELQALLIGVIFPEEAACPGSADNCPEVTGSVYGEPTGFADAAIRPRLVLEGLGLLRAT